MPVANLFQLAQEMREALSKVDPETGEISEDYQKSQSLFNEKKDACLAYYVAESLDIESAEKMLKQMADTLASRKSRHSRFKEYLLACMRLAGKDKISNGLITATVYKDRDESVEIDEGVDVPSEYLCDPKPPPPSKSKIKAAILAGVNLTWARIVNLDRITIK